ncbi:MAG: hypothetical protein AAF108_06135 [Planctomycetota bacterium]
MTLAALLPPLAVFPAAGVLMVVIAGHILAMRRADMPRTRRRIRIANAWVMLTLTPLVAGLFGYLGPDEPRAFVLVSTACVFLLGLMVLLAMIDATNNARLTAKHRRELRVEIARFQAETARAIAEAKRGEEDTPDLRLADDEGTESA